jgi:hypothetical protein
VYKFWSQNETASSKICSIVRSRKVACGAYFRDKSWKLKTPFKMNWGKIWPIYVQNVLKWPKVGHLPKISNSTKIVMCFIFLCVFCVILFHPSLFFVNPPLNSSSSNYSFLHIFFIYFITFEERNNERETFIRTSFMMMFSFTYSHYYY